MVTSVRSRTHSPPLAPHIMAHGAVCWPLSRVRAPQRVRTRADFFNCGNYGIVYYENTGTPTAPAYTSAGNAGALQGVTPSWSSEAGFGLTFNDFDGDDDWDAILCVQGRYHYMENTGTKTSPTFVDRGQPNSNVHPFFGLGLANEFHKPAPLFLPRGFTFADAASD